MSLNLGPTPAFFRLLLVMLPASGLCANKIDVEPLLPQGVGYVVDDGTSVLTATFLFHINRVLTDEDVIHATLLHESHVILQETLRVNGSPQVLGLYAMHMHETPPYVRFTVDMCNVTRDKEGEYEVRLHILPDSNIFIETQLRSTFSVTVRQGKAKNHLHNHHSNSGRRGDDMRTRNRHGSNEGRRNERKKTRKQRRRQRSGSRKDQH